MAACTQVLLEGDAEWDVSHPGLSSHPALHIVL